MNTRIDFTYRDGGNNKTHGHIVVAGDPTPALLVRLAATLDEGDQFGPLDVGISPVWPTPFDIDLDHTSHEVEIIDADFLPGWDGDTAAVTGDSPAVYATATDQAPTDPRTLDQLVDAFERAAEARWPSMAMDAAQTRMPTPAVPVTYRLGVDVEMVSTLADALDRIRPAVAAMDQADRRDAAVLTHATLAGSTWTLEFTVVVDARDDDHAWQVVGPISVLLDHFDADGESAVEGPMPHNPARDDLDVRTTAPDVPAARTDDDLFDAPPADTIAEALANRWPTRADLPTAPGEPYDHPQVRGYLDGLFDIVIAPGSDDEDDLDRGMAAFDDHLDAAFALAYDTDAPADAPSRLDDPTVRARAIKALTRATTLGSRAAANVVDGHQPLEDVLSGHQRAVGLTLLDGYRTGHTSPWSVRDLLTATFSDVSLDVSCDGESVSVTHPTLGQTPLLRTSQWDTVVPGQPGATIPTGLPADCDDALAVAQRIAKIATIEAVRAWVDTSQVAGERRTVGALADVLSDSSQAALAARMLRDGVGLADAAALADTMVRLHGGETRLADLGL